jgi:hypothetical protein
MKTIRLSALAVASTLLVSANCVVNAQQIPQAPNMTFFVTSTPLGKGGDLGGLEGADAHRQLLASTVGAGHKTWRAYLSGPETPQAKGVNARDRIGLGPWQNAKGVVIAQNVDDLHSADNKLSRDTALTERGTVVAGIGYNPNWHDALTGSDRDGRAFPGNINIPSMAGRAANSGRPCSATSTAPGLPTTTTHAPGILRISRAAAARRT